MISEKRLQEIEKEMSEIAQADPRYPFVVVNDQYILHLVAEIRSLREALEWYADWMNYSRGDDLKVFDPSERARRALGVEHETN